MSSSASVTGSVSGRVTIHAPACAGSLRIDCPSSMDRAMGPLGMMRSSSPGRPVREMVCPVAGMSMSKSSKRGSPS